VIARDDGRSAPIHRHRCSSRALSGSRPSRWSCGTSPTAGRPEGDGVLVPLDLDHALLARIVGASKATVTTAIGALQRRGALERVEQGWMLHGPPPTQLHDMREQTEG
jgi:hypothetical protein